VQEHIPWRNNVKVLCRTWVRCTRRYNNFLYRYHELHVCCGSKRYIKC